MFVNDTNLENGSLEEAVQALKGAATGTVKIGVAKPLPVRIWELNGYFPFHHLTWCMMILTSGNILYALEYSWVAQNIWKLSLTCSCISLHVGVACVVYD